MEADLISPVPYAILRRDSDMYLLLISSVNVESLILVRFVYLFDQLTYFPRTMSHSRF
jgi:hypothetical protein